MFLPKLAVTQAFKAALLIIPTVGCFALVTSLQATAQEATSAQVAPETKQLQMERYRLIDLDVLSPKKTFDNRDLEFLDDAPLLQNDVPVGLGLTSDCFNNNQTDSSKIREAIGWIDNGDGTARFVDQICQ